MAVSPFRDPCETHLVSHCSLSLCLSHTGLPVTSKCILDRAGTFSLAISSAWTALLDTCVAQSTTLKSLSQSPLSTRPLPAEAPSPPLNLALLSDPLSASQLPPRLLKNVYDYSSGLVALHPNASPMAPRVFICFVLRRIPSALSCIWRVEGSQ